MIILKKISGIIYGTIKDDNNLLEVSINQNERKSHERKSYFYTIRTIDGNNDWTGEPGTASNYILTDFQKAKLINEYAQNEAIYNCVIDISFNLANFVT